MSLDSAEPVKHQTLTRLLCDRKYLYAAFTCDHPDPSNLRTAAAKGNNFSLYTDDSVELFLDPANKRLDYFHILVNAAGVCGYASTKGKWACRGMKIKVTRSETAWHAEIALPLSALGVKARRNMKWGVNFCRNLSAPRHQASSWAWSGADFHRPVRFGIITFK